jgi:hypothetical protein
MAQATKPSNKTAAAPSELRESNADRASGFILAMLILVGGLVVALLFIWFSMAIQRPPVISPAVRLDPGPGGDPLGVRGETLHVEGPEREEISKETDAVEPEVQEVMAMVTDALAKQVADVDNPLFTDDLDSGPAGGHKGNSRKRGFGFGGGPGGGGAVWEMQYDESTLAIYSQQLDFFKIELAVVGGSKDRIEYASNFGQGQARRRSGTRDEELKTRRTYFTHRSGTVQRYDQQLLTRSGISWQGPGKIILQYYPPEAEQQLLALQQQFRNLEQEVIAKTVFGVRRKGSGFEFYVVDQVRR